MCPRCQSEIIVSEPNGTMSKNELAYKCERCGCVFVRSTLAMDEEDWENGKKIDGR